MCLTTVRNQKRFGERWGGWGLGRLWKGLWDVLRRVFLDVLLDCVSEYSRGC